MVGNQAVATLICALIAFGSPAFVTLLRVRGSGPFRF
jgi:hypothetical protein